MAEVVSTKRVTPHMMRVTLGGEELARFTPVGWDQWFRLFLPREGQDALRLPTRTSALWYAEYLATPRARRPWVRNYTVRTARPDLHEIDVDFVLHGNDDGHGDPDASGPGAGFAEAAEAGMRVGLLDQGIVYDADRAAGPALLVCDESGLPAVAGVCESLPPDARGTAVIEVPGEADRQEVDAPPGVELRWVVRSDPHAVPGQAALAALRDLDLGAPAEELYAFAVGESALATGARRHLVAERGVPKANVDFVGYWRHGRSSPG